MVVDIENDWYILTNRSTGLQGAVNLVNHGFAYVIMLWCFEANGWAIVVVFYWKFF